MHFMDKLHSDLDRKYGWYSYWHRIPHISAIHLFVLIGLGSLTASSLVNVVEAQSLSQNSAVSAVASSDNNKPGRDFGPWFDISLWRNCSHLMNQGSVFEVQNSEGQSMWSECTPEVPASPFGWNSGPARFRLVKEPPAIAPDREHPLPPHVGGGGGRPN